MNVNHFQHDPLTVGIIGQGYVGLPLALRFAEVGVRAIGFDVDEKKVALLNAGQSFIQYIASDRIQRLRTVGAYEATSDLKRLAEPDVILICVPTPLDRHMQPDLSFIVRSAESIARTLRPGQLVVLESTTYPGCTRRDVLPLLEATGLKLDQDFALAFSPEREDPSNNNFSTHNTPKLVGGITPLSTQVAYAFYARAIQSVIAVSSAEVAESAKLLENIFRSVNIALVNELKMVFDKMGVDVWEVIRAASTKPFGFMPFYPGPGLGGHCIPIDPFYLTWRAKEFGMDTLFIELAGQINRSMPAYVIQRLMQALNDRQLSLAGRRILMLGFSYKKNVGDDRESPAYEIYEALHHHQASVDYHDPFIPSVRPTRAHKIHLTSTPLTVDALSTYDAVIIVTDHSGIDYDLIQRHARLVIDTRNVYPVAHDNVVKA